MNKKEGTNELPVATHNTCREQNDGLPELLKSRTNNFKMSVKMGY
jgi:hypothetical protein